MFTSRPERISVIVQSDTTVSSMLMFYFVSSDFLLVINCDLLFSSLIVNEPTVFLGGSYSYKVPSEKLTLMLTEANLLCFCIIRSQIKTTG